MTSPETAGGILAWIISTLMIAWNARSVRRVHKEVALPSSNGETLGNKVDALDSKLDTTNANVTELLRTMLEHVSDGHGSSQRSGKQRK